MNNRRISIRISASAASALLAAVLLAPTAAHADGPQAKATAAQHAGLAAGGADLPSVRRHLHHALNCLVGSEGEGFDAGPGNPCTASGAAIPQTSDAAAKAKLEKAAADLRKAIASDDVAVAKKSATDVQASLK
jgi:hypothetical protein